MKKTVLMIETLLVALAWTCLAWEWRNENRVASMRPSELRTISGGYVPPPLELCVKSAIVDCGIEEVRCEDPGDCEEEEGCWWCPYTPFEVKPNSYNGSEWVATGEHPRLANDEAPCALCLDCTCKDDATGGKTCAPDYDGILWDCEGTMEVIVPDGTPCASPFPY